MHVYKKLPALAAAVLLALPAAAGDLTIVFKTVAAGKPGSSTEYMTTNKLRMSDGERDTIVDTAAGRITSIDHQKKEYSELTVAEMEAAMQAGVAKLAEGQAKQQEAMKNMPPAMRERMQKMMGGAGGPLGAIKVTPGAGGRKVAGYDTQSYVMTMGEAMRTEMWATTALHPPIQPGEMLRLQSMLNPMMKGMGAAMDEFKKIQGLTLASTTSVSVMGKSMESSREATEIKTDPIPASVFAVPAGYKKVESPLARMGH
jgi:hypothetical protein